MTDWISVEAKPRPEIDQLVLLVNESGVIRIGIRNYNNVYMVLAQKFDATHWAVLPKPPQSRVLTSEDLNIPIAGKAYSLYVNFENEGKISSDCIYPVVGTCYNRNERRLLLTITSVGRKAKGSA